MQLILFVLNLPSPATTSVGKDTEWLAPQSFSPDHHAVIGSSLPPFSAAFFSLG